MLKWIKFKVKYRVKAAGGPAYEAGQVEQMSLASCRHFVSRGLAEYCGHPVIEVPVVEIPVVEEPVAEEPFVEEQEEEKPKRTRRRKITRDA